MKKRLFVIFFALLMLFCSCGSDTVMEYESTRLSEGMYHYLFASMKQYYLDTYSDIEDTEQFWSGEALDGRTYAEYIDAQINEAIRDFVISSAMFDAAGNKIDAEGKEQIEAFYQDAVTLFGGEKALATALSRMDLDADGLREAYALQYKYERMLYDSGIAQADDQIREEYYQSKYTCVKIIYIASEQGYVTDGDGDRVIGTDGYYQMYALSEQEKAAKVEAADRIEAALDADPARFESLYTDPTVNELDVAYYPNGLYLCADTPNAAGLPAVEDAAFHMEIGEHRRVSDESGIYFVLRCPLPDKAYDDDIDYIQFTDMDEMCARYRFRELMDERLPALRIDEKKIANYSVISVDAVSY